MHHGRLQLPGRRSLVDPGLSKVMSNRIKMLKRQMFGRAGLQLLRKRVLQSC
jgi:transposase